MFRMVCQLSFSILVQYKKIESDSHYYVNWRPKPHFQPDLTVIGDYHVARSRKLVVHLYQLSISERQNGKNHDLSFPPFFSVFLMSYFFH